MKPNGMKDIETTDKYASLEERMKQHDHDIEMLQGLCERFTALEKRIEERDHVIEVLQSTLGQFISTHKSDWLDSVHTLAIVLTSVLG
jgi:hypothetical protein